MFRWLCILEIILLVLSSTHSSDGINRSSECAFKTFIQNIWFLSLRLWWPIFFNILFTHSLFFNFIFFFPVNFLHSTFAHSTLKSMLGDSLTHAIVVLMVDHVRCCIIRACKIIETEFAIFVCRVLYSSLLYSTFCLCVCWPIRLNYWWRRLNNNRLKAVPDNFLGNSANLLRL